jgi:hypothetical protein
MHVCMLVVSVYRNLCLSISLWLRESFDTLMCVCVYVCVYMGGV